MNCRKAARVKVQRTIKQSTKDPKEQRSRSPKTLKPKYNQKFCEKWLKIFDPWLRRAAEDPNKPFCRACQCTMDCNRCHLVRHERTTKHKRNLESLLTKGEGAAVQEFRIRQERSKYYHQRKLAMRNEEEQTSQAESQDLTPPTECSAFPASTEVISDSNICSPAIEEVSVPKKELISETESSAKVSEPTPSPSRHSGSTAGSNQEGIKLLMQIHQDKNELMDSFRELMGSQRSLNHAVPPKEKNHVDLFFESVSSSVKALSPKLVAEAKMRVSQLICELELRGLKETSPQEDGVAINSNPPVNGLHVNRPSGHAPVQQHTGFSGVS
ncbi:protein suppressor of variegation 3-7 isoform X2 [Drosophila ficusphila]|uniref:protein suppressor of variegation 3-7 isoform X2 n=1 Tax=Drosophila ficusphila TaxID=30025 RepID=UPI0007E65B4B|nr:protein suppressor of variegation 3-7 isoform X2 [Drosophila ficusphila]